MAVPKCMHGRSQKQGCRKCGDKWPLFETPEPVDETVPFLLSVAENALREATLKAATSAHPVQLESLADSLLCVESAKHFFSKDPEYFRIKAEEE